MVGGETEGVVFEMKIEDYQTLIDQRISDLAAHNAHGHEVNASLCLIGIDERKPPLLKLREYCVNMLGIKPRQFDAAMQYQITKAVLGAYPENASEFIQLFTQSKGITAQFNGLLTMHDRPYVEVDGEREYFEPDQRPDLAAIVSTHFHRTIDFSHIQRDARLLVADLKLGYKDSLVNDASGAWYDFVKRDRLQHIMNLVSHEKLDNAGRNKILQEFSSLVEKCFDESKHTTQFVVAVFRKYIHQVKRKMHGLPVERHLMPIIMGGKQGSGKTTLVRKLMGVLKEVALETNFNQIGDDRVIDMWRNFMLFVDEMAWSSRAEMSTIKYLVSAESIDRRRMQQNHTDNVVQNSSLIGTSNKGSVAELFFDVTGLRRFVGLYAQNKMDWDAINKMDWLALWQSVSPYDTDPILAILGDLEKMQEEERPKSPIESWLEHVDWYTAFNGAMRQSNPPKFDSHDLFEVYTNYERQFFPQRNTHTITFGQEIGRLSRLDTPAPYFKRATNAKGTCWQWARPPVTNDNTESDNKSTIAKIHDIVERRNHRW
jgi:energy-coupling factor transporter ATP-binding protein EcfA2